MTGLKLECLTLQTLTKKGFTGSMGLEHLYFYLSITIRCFLETNEEHNSNSISDTAELEMWKYGTQLRDYKRWRVGLHIRPSIGHGLHDCVTQHAEVTRPYTSILLILSVQSNEIKIVQVFNLVDYWQTRGDNLRTYCNNNNVLFCISYMEVSPDNTK